MLEQKLNFYLITICGGSASGKSSILKGLRENFSENELCIISYDDYYRPIDEQVQDEKGYYNFDLPGSIDDQKLMDDLLRLSQQETIELYEYTFGNSEKIPEKKTLKPAKVVVVEGLFALYFKRLQQNTNYKVFISADENLRYERRKKRDLTERKISFEMFQHQWLYHVKPAYDQFVLPFENNADLVIENNSDFSVGLNNLVQHIKNVLG